MNIAAVVLDEGFVYPLVTAGFLTTVGLIGWTAKQLFESGKILSGHDVRITNLEDDVKELKT